MIARDGTQYFNLSAIAATTTTEALRSALERVNAFLQASETNGANISEVLNENLIELKKMNTYLASMSDIEVTDTDIGE